MLKEKSLHEVDVLMERYPALEGMREQLVDTIERLARCAEKGGKVLVCGNGGSAADSLHIVGELMKGFRNPRKISKKESDAIMALDPVMGKNLVDKLQEALPAIALDGHVALTTAYLNDCEPLMCFAQQVQGYGCEGDVLLAISTSGNSQNVLYAATVAKAKGLKVIGLTGANESKLSAIADVCVRVPQTETYMIQELHLPVYHWFCLKLEETFWK